MSPKKTPSRATWPATDAAVGAAALAFIALISLFPVRNNDIWWHMAAGAEMLRTHRFITHDPFMFSAPGAPWVPHSWLADILFYLVHAAASAAGLVVLRALLVTGIFFLVLRLIRRLGISLTLAAPIVLVAALNAHSRFIIRPHLFEYLFMVLLLSHLLTSRHQQGLRFFLFPLLLQVLWVNTHATFYFGIAMTVLFFTGEWLSRRLARPFGTRGFLMGDDVAWRNVGLLVGLMVAVSFINPSPIEFVFQPLDAERRELLTRYTLEWRSPFDPLMKGGAFHPYYEMMLAITAAAFALSVKRLKLSSLLLVGFFAALSFQSHRFRVEFSLLAAPLLLDQLKSSPLVAKLAGRRLAAAPYVVSLLLAALLVYTARERIMIGGTVSDRFPTNAFHFARDNDVAKRSFHTAGFGSYLIWELYPERQSFVDGRMIDVGVQQDFFAAQTNSGDFNRVIRKYDLDAFIVPAPELSDGGMSNIHKFLIDSKGWSLAHIDRIAFVYVKNDKVPPEWLDRHAYRVYHPMTFSQTRFTAAQIDSAGAELTRATAGDPTYVRPLLDLARVQATGGEWGDALASIERALALEPDNAEAHGLRRALIERKQ